MLVIAPLMKKAVGGKKGMPGEGIPFLWYLSFAASVQRAYTSVGFRRVIAPAGSTVTSGVRSRRRNTSRALGL